MSNETIHVEVVYALPKRQKLLSLQVPRGTSARDAAKLSGIAEEFPEIDLNQNAMGIFGQALGARGLPDADQYVLKEGDRVEIYRPLIADPKEVRKQRARDAEKRRQQEKRQNSPDSTPAEGA